MIIALQHIHVHEDLVTLELKLRYCKCYAQSDVSLLDCVMVEYVYNSHFMITRSVLPVIV